MTDNRLQEIKNLFLSERARDYLSNEVIDAIDELIATVETADKKDPYGIPNVCFSLEKPSDEAWEESIKDRLEHGFDESECWNLDSTIAKFILPRLKCFAEHTMGYPGDITSEEWHEILNKIIKAFELYTADDAWLYEEMKKDGITLKENSRNDQIKEGLELFVKYFSSLWW